MCQFIETESEEVARSVNASAPSLELAEPAASIATSPSTLPNNRVLTTNDEHQGTGTTTIIAVESVAQHSQTPSDSLTTPDTAMPIPSIESSSSNTAESFADAGKTSPIHRHAFGSQEYTTTTRPDTSIFLYDSSVPFAPPFASTDDEQSINDSRPSTPNAPILTVSEAVTNLAARLPPPSSPYRAPARSSPAISVPASSSATSFPFNLYPFNTATAATVPEPDSIPPEYLPNIQPLPPVFPRPLQRSPSYIDPRLSSSSSSATSIKPSKDPEAVEHRLQTATQQIQAAVKQSLRGKVKTSSAWVASGAQDWVLGHARPAVEDDVVVLAHDSDACEIEVCPPSLWPSDL